MVLKFKRQPTPPSQPLPKNARQRTQKPRRAHRKKHPHPNNFDFYLLKIHLLAYELNSRGHHHRGRRFRHRGSLHPQQTRSPLPDSRGAGESGGQDEDHYPRWVSHPPRGLLHPRPQRRAPHPDGDEGTSHPGTPQQLRKRTLREVGRDGSST